MDKQVYTIQLNDYPMGNQAYTTFKKAQDEVIKKFGTAPDEPNVLIKIKDMTFVRIYEFNLV